MTSTQYTGTVLRAQHDNIRSGLRVIMTLSANGSTMMCVQVVWHIAHSLRNGVQMK